MLALCRRALKKYLVPLLSLYGWCVAMEFIASLMISIIYGVNTSENDKAACMSQITLPSHFSLDIFVIFSLSFSMNVSVIVYLLS